MILAHLAVRSWLPKSKWPGELWSRVWGLLILGAGASIALLICGYWQALVMATVIVGVGGLADILAHGGDKVSTTWQKVQMIERNYEDLQSVA